LIVRLKPYEAAQMLSVSRDYFDQHVKPELRIVHRASSFVCSYSVSLRMVTRLFPSSPRRRTPECGSELGHVPLEALDYLPRRVTALNLLTGEALLANCSLDGAPNPSAHGHSIGVGEPLHLLDRLGREPHRDVLRQRSRGSTARRAGRRLALRGILVVLERFGVGHRRESSSYRCATVRLGS
jgi:hypothetical protein